MTGVKTSIGWCTHTNNAITGCYGPNGKMCHYCWAKIFRKRVAGVPGTIQFALREANLDINSPAYSLFKLDMLALELLRARVPRRIFFSSMGDLGYDGLYHQVSEGRVLSRFFVGAYRVRASAKALFHEAPKHTFLILSKQPAGLTDTEWPDNVQVGISAATPEELAGRLPILLDNVTAKFKWISLEPLLGEGFNRLMDESGTLDWVVVGAQTGKGKIPAPQVIEAKKIVKLCRDRSIPCYVKPNMQEFAPDWPWPAEIPEVSL